MAASDWIKAETRNDYILLWRGSPAQGWQDSLVFHQRDGFHGGGDFSCRPDGEVCIIEGQLMKFDPQALLDLAGGLLPEHSPLRP